MQRPGLLLCLLSILFLPFVCFSQPDLTAAAIVQRAIDSSGGPRFDTLRGLELVHELQVPGGSVSVATKRLGGDRLLVSTLSLGYSNTTKIYNRGRAVLIANDTVRAITNPAELEDLQLQCYVSIDYGYQKLHYALERLEDQKFQNFDCYVVQATSPLGIRRLTYYDKRNGRLLMIVYPNGHKAILTHYYTDGGFHTPSQVLQTADGNSVTPSLLRKFFLTPDLDEGWFALPPEGPLALPARFRKGRFHYTGIDAGQWFERSETSQTEHNATSAIVFHLEWIGPNDYLRMRLKDPAKPATNDNIDATKVRILGWNAQRCYGQYLTADNTGGTFAFEPGN